MEPEGSSRLGKRDVDVDDDDDVEMGMMDDDFNKKKIN